MIARRPRILIESVAPVVDCGRYAPKRRVGDLVTVEATVVRDGHDQLRAALRHTPPGAEAPLEAPMRPVPDVPDRWTGTFPTSTLGRHRFTVMAWVDRFASWREEVRRKVAAAQEDLGPELAEGVALVADLAATLDGGDAAIAGRALEVMGSLAPQEERVAAAMAPELEEAMARTPERADATQLSRELEVDVDSQLASVGAWYELFPRSWGGLAGVRERLPRLAELGFDVIYLPPIHPIGHTHRKGRNNAPQAEPGDPGSPWAIGADDGGHTAVHSELGTMDDLEALVADARELGMEVALDFAIQCSPDHPWLRDHPEWFHRRPDGTLKYAENPPKRYQDIYNVDFASEDWEALWAALLDVVLFWVERGVRIFRVDNPHTKPLPFWEWLIGEVRGEHPEVVFLAEAFTRPAMMTALAKLGFNQSYTYFTWKTSRHELTEYLTELASPAMRDVFRPNFFVNTPDILHATLQEGGRPTFEARVVLAATLGPSYGVYSGYEHIERTPVRAGSEEYLDSEKYEVRRRELDGPLLPLISRLNRIRRRHPELTRLDDLVFLPTANDALIAYAKGRGGDTMIVVVNLDPWAPQAGLVEVPTSLGLPPGYSVRDLLSGSRYDWVSGGNYVRLDPAIFPAHVLAVEGVG
jgi:starch synthase (maltosyl-transferring)